MIVNYVNICTSFLNLLKRKVKINYIFQAILFNLSNFEDRLSVNTF